MPVAAAVYTLRCTVTRTRRRDRGCHEAAGSCACSETCAQRSTPDLMIPRGCFVMRDDMCMAFARQTGRHTWVIIHWHFDCGLNGRAEASAWLCASTHPVVAGLEAPDAVLLHLEAPQDPARAARLQVCLRLGVPGGAHLRAGTSEHAFCSAATAEPGCMAVHSAPTQCQGGDRLVSVILLCRQVMKKPSVIAML